MPWGRHFAASSNEPREQHKQKEKKGRRNLFSLGGPGLKAGEYRVCGQIPISTDFKLNVTLEGMPWMVTVVVSSSSPLRSWNQLCPTMMA